MWLVVLACTPEPLVADDLSVPSLGADPTAPPEGGPETSAPPPLRCESVSSEERDYLPQGQTTAGEAPACTVLTHPSSGASGSTLLVSVGGASAEVTDFSGAVLAGPGSTGSFEITLPSSGEIFVTLAERAQPSPYEISIQCVSGCDRQWTRYPLLLMHGLGGADAFDGVEYFYEIPSGLSDLGVEVLAPAVSPFAVPADRASEWEVHLDALLARGHRRVNLFGHSLGGIDARVLASPGGLSRGAEIASVTTLGSPHGGSEVADLLRDGFESGVLDEGWFDIGAEIFGLMFGIDASDPAFADTIASMTTEGAQQISLDYPDHPDTAYFSWAGRSCGVLEPWCQDDHGGEIVDPLLATSYLLMWPTPNDGLVPTASQQHGLLLGEIDADHADQTGQFQDEDNPAFDHRAFYLDEVRRLREAGL